MKHTPFVHTDAGLIAQNSDVYLLLSPAHGPLIYEGESLAEETACNCLARSAADAPIQLFIDDQPAEALGFLRDGHALWGRITTGNRPGRIRFRIRRSGRDILQTDLHVRPAKLDYETDFLAMRADIERICRQLLYVLPEHARMAMGACDADAGSLDFFQLIERLFERLFQTCRAILNQPNRRLAQSSILRPANRATGHDPDALIHLVRTPSTWTDAQNAQAVRLPVPNRRLGVTALRETYRYATTDTPANRWLVAQLRRLYHRASALARRLQPEPQSHRLHMRSRRLQHILRDPALHAVSPAPPADAFPARLDARYQQAFAILRDLDRALAPFSGGPFELSYRDTPALYEYWTWFTVIGALIDMGFAPQSDLFHLTHRGITLSPAQGEPSAIHLRRGGVRVRCLYNFTYTRASGRASTHDLRPDIILDVHAHSKKRAVHAFDAKYRRENAGACWAPLRDDIDKMHAYRDAIGQITPEGFQRALKSAIVLFPAPLQPAYRSHPFCESLPHGIGGLPLLPGDPHTLAELRAHLERCFTK